MNVDQKVEAFKVSKYEMENLKIKTSHGELDIEPRKIRDITILKNFDEHFLPILNINVGLTGPEYYKILDSVKEVTVDVTFKSFEIEPEVDNDRTKVKKFTRPIVKGTFSLILDDMEPYVSKEHYESYDEDDANTEDRELDLLLYNKTHISQYRKLHNFIIASATPLQAIAYLLDNYGGSTLLQKPDNSRSINEFISPPNNFLGSVKWMQEYYGIYNKGLCLFQDFNVLYFMDKDPCKVWRPKEYKRVRFYIPKVQDNNSAGTGIFKDIDELFTVVNESSYELINTSIVSRNTYGNSIHAINLKSNSSSNVKANMEADTSPATKILNNYGGNTFVVNSAKHELESGNLIMKINLIDIPYDILTPNKEFIIEYEDVDLEKRFGGKFRLSNVNYIFTRNTDENYSVSTNIEIKKVG